MSLGALAGSIGAASRPPATTRPMPLKAVVDVLANAV